MTTTTVPQPSEELTERMHELYRHLHAHPELSMQEHATAELIERELDALGVEHFRCGGTGVVGVLRNGQGPVVAFRADTDGLPLAEDTGLDYASTATGRLEDGTEVPVMHGCGHDTHVAVLLTAARLLAGAREAWSGTLVLVFQPGEETAAGAQAMLADGLWERAPRPEVVLGQHVMPQLAGTIHCSVGDAMAMADSWRVTVHGKGAHASQPQDATDPIVLGAHIITRLQTVVAREVDPRRSAVVTVGTFHGGLKENIIPARAEFTLNVRTLDPEVREHVLGALRRIISAEAAASGAPEPTVEVLSTFPRNYNDPAATTELLEHFRRELGEERVVQVDPLMGSEDFGALGAAIGVPSVFWMFGGHDAATLAGEGPVPVNHSPFFAPAVEPTLSTGVRAAVVAILARLGR
ncbi:amidohydrolase [Kocuria flava]|uniref:Amidohydrolase n=1 Tax=Kocuria flava TaxID=446860 RepID=A0A0U3H8I8_9MICC|nr:amidohydrolase [Kocuria flava]ALU39221.1 amidohydrolase [Kocuria flava]GEO91260.1 putative amidohydrolase [Kocuria flava]